MTKEELINFELNVAKEFEAGEIKGPVHLSGGNEDQLIDIFKQVSCGDWVFSTWRNHFHALLHGIPAEKVMTEIRAGRSMNLCFPEHRFYSSAIVGGILPIATGVAAGLKRKGCGRKVWCFVGDMAATTGAYHEAYQYASNQDLPITFVVEDNGLSTNAPTADCWGHAMVYKQMYYRYDRTYPHSGIGKWVQF